MRLRWTVISSIVWIGLIINGHATPPNTLREKATVRSAPEQTPTTLSARQAIEKLRDGNTRFMHGKPLHPHEKADWRSLLEDGQHPFAVVLGCADSRVPPELIFDQGFGDLFVIRVAGNVVDTDVIASVEYAIDHLETPLLVVMGHTHCGAVSATVDLLSDTKGEAAEVVSLLYRIEPAVMQLDPALPREAKIEAAIRKNVELAVRRLSRVPDLRRQVLADSIKITGAVYDMHTGQVQFIDDVSNGADGSSTNRK
ncbi:MAG: carbonic anhydrase [Planctomycetota bacterium]